MAKSAYMDPLPQFFELGRPEAQKIEDWVDYPATYGLTSSHIPDLVKLMIYDIREDKGEWIEPEGYASIHAWRALGQMKATEAIPHMFQLLVDDTWGDWGWEDVPPALALIGEPVIEPLKKQLRRDASEPIEVISLVTTLEYLGNIYPELRERCIDILIHQLKYAPTNDRAINANLILQLTNWKVESALGIIERAFAGDHVDTMIMGDWDDVQVEFGLKEPEPIEERTQIERMQDARKLFGLPDISDDDLVSDTKYYLDPLMHEPTQEDLNQQRKKEKEKEKRRAKKKAAKKNRKRKRK